MSTFNFPIFLKEVLVSEISLKQFKLQNKGYEGLVDYIANNIENKYIPVIFKYSTSAFRENIRAKYLAGDEEAINNFHHNVVDKFINMFKIYDKALKTGLIDRLAKENGLDSVTSKNVKDVNFWIKHEWEAFGAWMDKINKRFRSKEMEKKAKGDIEVLIDNDEIMMIVPKSKEAACVYGRGTKWCISATESKNYYEQYVNNGVIFFLILNKKKKLEASKIAVAAYITIPGKYEVYDAADNNLNDMDDESLAPIDDNYGQATSVLIKNTIEEYMSGLIGGGTKQLQEAENLFARIKGKLLNDR